MNKYVKAFAKAMVLPLVISMCGCSGNTENKKKVHLIIRVPPIGLGNIPEVGEVEIYDLFIAASEKFKQTYQTYDVSFDISRYFYLDEKEQIVDKYNTPEAVDVFYSGSYNTPTYVANGWLTPLDDIVDETLRKDIDETLWQQNSIDGKVFIVPFQQFQNTLMVNRSMMINAGLDEYIPIEGTIAKWSTEELDYILSALKDSFSGKDNKFAFMMYAKNNQGDNHIMTLLRAFGCPIYTDEGYFSINTPEGIQALQWIKDLNDQGITPKGAENIDLLSCVNLFNNSQLAICVGNLSNLTDAWNKDIDVFLANFPSQDGEGYVTSSLNGFCVFDNQDVDKIKASKDFIRFIYTQEDLMRYTLGTLPVNRSTVEKYQDTIPLLKAYTDNTKNTVDNIRNNLNWQGVRDVFYLNIQDLLLGNKTPQETAESIDEQCNNALAAGRDSYI